MTKTLEGFEKGFENIIKFKDLKIGDRFIFASVVGDRMRFVSYGRQGIKVSSNKYYSTENDHTFTTRVNETVKKR